MKRLLMLSYPFPPNATAGAVRSERFARYLPNHGWEVDVVTIPPRVDLFEDRNRLHSLGTSIQVHFTATVDPWLHLQPWRPQWLPLRAARSILLRLFSFPDHMALWVPFAVRAGLRIHRQRPVDAIYTTSPPHSTHLAGLALARIIGKPWFADFRDPWTLNAYRKNGPADKVMFKLEQRMERAVFRSAHTIFANTPSNRANLLRAFPFLPEDKVVHLPNGWEPFPDCLNVEDRRTSGALTIVHTGTFYPKFRPFGLLYGLAHWLDGIPERRRTVQIRILGARDAETPNIVTKLGLGDVVEILPWVSLDEARQAMVKADVLWASLGTGKESATYVPSKLFEYMAAGRPIWGFFPEGDAEELIRTTNTGIVFTSEQDGLVEKALDTWVAAKISGDRLPYAPIQPELEKFKVERIVGRFVGLLEAARQGVRT